MEYSTSYAIFLGVVGGVSFSCALGFLAGMRFGKKETERWLIPQIEHFSETVLEQHKEILALKQNNVPIKGSDSLSENILTREN